MIGLLCENIKFFYVLIIIIGHGFTFLSCSSSHGSFCNLFPQTYADLQNAHFGIEDGQYLISIGKATSSSYSWAFAEVILGYEIENNESKHAVDPINTGGKKTIYSHLKKYFCGTRFTRLPFLKRLKEKHKLGDVCVVEGSLSALLATLLAHFRYDVLDC
ncbi:hypothetical protein NC651_020604 [Populus alba x Populus x berolinensis]|nr:hypothetical protein NC651_020604 [Populus alba x Populus x berolinensis]